MKKERKKDLEFVITLLVLLVLVVLFVNNGRVYESSVTDAYNVGSIYVNSAVLENKKFEESVSPKAMCNISAEASIGALKTVYKQFMSISDDYVSGWKMLKKETKDSGLTYKFWVNTYDNSVYTLTIAGTDQIKDTTQYFPMVLSSEYPEQMVETLEIGKNLNSMISNAVNSGDGSQISELYITGHSLGGYLTAFLTSEIVDSYYNDSFDDIQYTEFLNRDFDITNLHCYTFGAPGFYNKMLPEGVLGVGVYANSPVPEWVAKKQRVNGDTSINGYGVNRYSDFITNYYNTLDLVGTLYVKDDNLKHLGKTIVLKVNNANPENLYLFSLSILKAPEKLYYHMPWVYINVLNQMQ